MGKQWEAVVAGHVCLDITPHFEAAEARDISEVLIPGKLVAMHGVELSTGGAAANTGTALTLMGISGTLMGKIGTDAFGSIVEDLSRKRGVAEGLLRVECARTSYTVALAPPGTDRILLHDPGANDTFVAADVRYEQVAHARLFHFGYPPIMEQMYAENGAELEAMFRRVKASGVTTSLDMALPDPSSKAGRADWQRIIERSLPYVDIFLPSVEEILYMLDRPQYERLVAWAAGHDMMEVLDIDILPGIAHRLLEYGACIVGIKCGKLGFFLATASADQLAAIGDGAPTDPERWAERTLFAETYKPDRILSTTGAGDSSIAGFLSALLRGRGPEQTLRVACAAGANTTRVYDTTSGVESLESMERWIASGPERNRLAYSGSAWRFDEAGDLWTMELG